jgi:hypothetical protein
MYLQIIHKYDSLFIKDIMQSKMPKVDGDLQVQNCLKMYFNNTRQKFKVASNVSNLQIILTQTNPNILSTHCLQYIKKSEWTKITKLWGGEKITLSVKVFAKATSNQQRSTSNETSTCSTMQR